MVKKLLIVVLVLIGLAVIIQFIPVDRSNPPVVADIGAPEPVASILRRSCYDCHSHETAWPFYSRIAPVSWMVSNDVHEGRKHMNFSTWDSYSPEQQQAFMYVIKSVVEEGEMPPWFYLPAHPEARLSDQDKQSIYEWTQAVQ